MKPVSAVIYCTDVGVRREVSRALTPPVSAWHRAWVLAHPVLVLIAASGSANRALARPLGWESIAAALSTEERAGRDSYHCGG
jgi:hypothetical protein